MAKSYPESYLRYNGDFLQYTEVAMEHYLSAKKEYDCIEKSRFLVPIDYDRTKFENNCIITIVFATMAIESFLNDYAAACLGDSNFYDSFDKLDILAKFQLIAKFILEKDFDKGSFYYCSLKKLIKKRNAFIHNKSIALDYDKMQKYAVVKIVGEERQIEGHIKPLYEETRNAIEAIVEVAKYFEKNDKNSHAYLRLLGKGFVEEITERYIVRQEIYKEFKI